jgi:DNA-3-methyladenine glycosylase
MYAAAGTAYVYICYGMHQMLNIVTNKKEVPDAILIRAVAPLQGLNIMQQRTGKLPGDFTITRGPGNVAKAFGISKIHSGINLTGKQVYLLHDPKCTVPDETIGVSARIGVDYAGADAALPYRFFLKGNKYVSGGRKHNGT